MNSTVFIFYTRYNAQYWKIRIDTEIDCQLWSGFVEWIRRKILTGSTKVAIENTNFAQVVVGNRIPPGWGLLQPGDPDKVTFRKAQ